MSILAHQIVAAENAQPGSWIYFLHGVFGAGRNWATVARRVVQARPACGAVLVDLRMHGASQDFAGPHTLASAAQDVAHLAEAIGRPVSAIVAHSFGGKVALVYMREHSAHLKDVWIVDSTPVAAEPTGSAWSMLGVLQRTPGPFATRAAAVEALQQGGVASGVAQWVSTNLVESESGYVWRLDLGAIELLLRDFFAEDLWSVVEEPPAAARLHFIKAERSSVLGEDACSRIAAAGAANKRVFLHRVEGGHWLNADNPDAIVKLLVEG